MWGIAVLAAAREKKLDKLKDMKDVVSWR